MDVGAITEKSLVIGVFCDQVEEKKLDLLTLAFTCTWACTLILLSKTVPSFRPRIMKRPCSTKKGYEKTMLDSNSP